MNSHLTKKVSKRRSPVHLMLEALTIASICASTLALSLRYGSLPEKIPDLFPIGSGMVPKTYLLALLVLQAVVYVLLTLFQNHPQWRMYSRALLPVLRDERQREALYRFSSLFLLTAKTEAAFTFGTIVFGAIFAIHVTVPILVLAAVMLLTMLFFKTDMPKQKA